MFREFNAFCGSRKFGVCRLCGVQARFHLKVQGTRRIIIVYSWAPDLTYAGFRVQALGFTASPWGL